MESMLENGSEIDDPILENRSLRDGFGGPDGILGVWGGLCWQNGAQEDAKMQPRSPKRLQRGRLGRTWGRSWRQDGAMLANLVPKMATMAAFGGPSWLILPIWRGILQESGKCKKTLENLRFFKVFGGGRVGRGGIWIPFWAMLVHLGSKLSCLGSSRQHLATS